MVTLATSGRQQSAILISFTLRCRSPKRLDRIASNLVGLLYMSSDNLWPRNDVIYYFRSAAVDVTMLRASSSGLLSASAVSSCYRSTKRSIGDAVLSSCTGRAGGRKQNEPLVLGSPNLVHRFTPTPSRILPEMVSLATSGRQQSAIL